METNTKITKLKRKSQYPKWKFLWIAKWSVDPVKQAILNREIDIQKLYTGRPRMEEGLIETYKEAEMQMKIELINNISSTYADQIVTDYSNPINQRFNTLWDSLNEVIEGDHSITTAKVIHKLRNLVFKNNMSKYVKEFQNIERQLRRLGGEWTKTQLLEEFLRPLPARYNSTINAICKVCRRDPEWNFEEVLKDILLEDFQLEISRNRENPRKSY